jgi:hypothetical protein
MRVAEVASRAVCVLGLVLLLGAPASAGPREQARKLHDRLAGVPPSAAVLDQMAALIATGDPADTLAAANLAMQNPQFLMTTVKNMVTPWTNVERTVHADLNDYTALVIGMIRDDVPFNQVLTADLMYVGANVNPAYSQTDNAHYQALESQRVDLSNPALFTPVPQSTLPGSQIMAADAAGVITTRAAGEAFFSAGTNRRMWRFTTLNYLCRDMELLHDITRPVDRIRQDVSRSPGGDSRLFHNACSGCHGGMDAVAGAFAYFDWDPVQMRVVYTPGSVAAKYLINGSNFPYGYITSDNSWSNYWRQGSHANLEWRGPNANGYGAKTLGEEVAASRAFSVCQVEKVFQTVCFRPPNSMADGTKVDDIATIFEANNYSMKRVFAEVGAYCMGN